MFGKLNEKDFNMRLERKRVTKDVNNQALVRDRYGILQLAANATMTRTPQLSPLSLHMLKKWGKKVFITIIQFWNNNSIYYPDLIGMEPSDFINQLYWQARLKKGKDE